jgi:hypothetical protein
MNNSWTRTDDEAVALHYLHHGDAEHDKIIAALPHHKPGSIRMRLDNLKALDTAGAHGLPNAAQQQRDVWAFASAVRDALRRLLSTLRRDERGAPR